MPTVTDVLKDAERLTHGEQVALALTLLGKFHTRENEAFGRLPEAARQAAMNFDSLRMAIAACIYADCVVPALVLLYAGIDMSGALAWRQRPYRADRNKFKVWAERYFIPRLKTAVTPDELYAARCGIVHLYSSESDHNGEASGNRSIGYVSSDGEKPFWSEEFKSRGGNEGVLRGSVMLSVQEMFEAFNEGWKEMFIEAGADAKWRPIFEANCKQQLAEILRPTK